MFKWVYLLRVFVRVHETRQWVVVVYGYYDKKSGLHDRQTGEGRYDGPMEGQERVRNRVKS